MAAVGKAAPVPARGSVWTTMAAVTSTWHRLKVTGQPARALARTVRDSVRVTAQRKSEGFAVASLLALIGAVFIVAPKFQDLLDASARDDG